ncbi:ABC transporter permease [Terrimonas alba]|uniref:ABC transporter permease n=1 Tax=Terrimonas alba TaxID=3349636 RepID=UPI0035F44E9A
MIKNYIKIACRSLFRNKGFSFTNVLGLAIGMTCTLLILLWVKDERTYNKFHRNYSNIYQVMAHRDFKNQIFTDRNMVLPLAGALQAGIPEIKNAVVTTYPQPHVLTYGDLKLKQEGYTVSEHFFDMFTWKFIKGNAATALHDAYSIVLTESTAKALFGNNDPVNKVVRVDNEYDAKVTAIVEDAPANSSLQFDFINAFNYSNDFLKQAMTNWQNSSWNVYINLNAGANMKAVEKKINEIKHSHTKDDKKVSTYFAFPMSKWRLYSDFKDGKNTGGMIEYVRLFTVIAFIILLIACVNFMNLSTARSEKRAKEVGVRKTLGSDKKQLVLQFFFESVILALIAFVFAIAAVYVLLPSFNTLVGKDLSLDITSPLFWLVAACIIVLTGIVAGSYPALYLSSFNAVKVLKGTFLPGKKGIIPRRMLVVVQFSISILLISATIIVYRQINHIKNRDIGYNPDNLIMIPTSPDTQKNFGVIKQELVQTGMVETITRTFSPITDVWWRSPAPNWDGKPADLNIIFSVLTTDVDFAKTVGVKMLQGKDFSGMPSDSSSLLLNKAAVEATGLKDPVGKQLKYGDRTYTVIGVTDNVVMGSPFNPVEPMVMCFMPGNTYSISIRLKPEVNLSNALKSVETVFKKNNPAVPFEYRFVDEEFGKKFATEELISRITNIFACLAIFICCLGLAGLVSFTVEKRIREIGIRKVLGASVPQVLLLVSAEFVKLVFIAFLIATPVAWWFMNNWLDRYEYHTAISFWLFGIVGIIMMLITLFVIVINALRAAITNPVNSLRTE